MSTSFRLGSIALFLLSSLAAIAAPGPSPAPSDNRDAPLRVVLLGLTHGHVNGFLRALDPNLLQLAGIWDPDPALGASYIARYGLDPALFSTDLPALLDSARAEAAWVFTDTRAHLAMVAACAPRGLHVIVEKPLAINLDHARRMASLAAEHRVHLLTNLETTWYGSLHETRRLAIAEGKLGRLTKIVSHFGHPGPAEIGVPPEFLDWLTDPERNGGGASADFGCYGANLLTWLLAGQRPLAVTAVFQTHKPATYPRVEDDATIIVHYPGLQGIIQASWDWSFSRKDLAVYGEQGEIRTLDSSRYFARFDRRADPAAAPLTAAPLPPELAGPLPYFTAVLRGRLDPAGSLSSLDNNLLAVEILDAARQSAASGQTVFLP